jgi:hypothetical protein
MIIDHPSNETGRMTLVSRGPLTGPDRSDPSATIVDANGRRSRYRAEAIFPSAPFTFTFSVVPSAFATFTT